MIEEPLINNELNVEISYSIRIICYTICLILGLYIWAYSKK